MTESPPSAPGRLELVRTFVNTRDIEAGRDRLSSADELVSCLADADLISAEQVATSAELRRAVTVREALRDLLRTNYTGTPAHESAVRVLDQAAGQLSIAFTGTGGWSVSPTGAGVDGAIGRLVAIVIESMTDGTWHRLKVCANATCEWAFYDRSRSRSGRWCYMGLCGNRTKQQAWRQRSAAPTRQRTDGTPPANKRG